jgi:vacuolar-type H+-ATPase subunit I/STV1
MTITRTAILVVALAACGKSKAEQCTKVIDAYNQVGEAMRKGFGDGTDPAAVDANVNEIEKAAKTFSALDVSDGGVKKVRDGLASVFDTHVANLREMAAGMRDAKDPKKADAALAKVNAVAAKVEGQKSAMVAAKQALMTECNATAK